MMKTLILALALPLAASAASYENVAAGYMIDLPPGWSTPSKADAAPALFVHQGESISVKLTVAAKGGPMGPADVERLKSGDEAALKKANLAYRSVPVQGPQVAAAPATHYGFVYKDAGGAVQLSRFALFSRARAKDHQWAKLNAVIPKTRLSTATPALEKLLAAFRWKAEAGAVVVAPTPVPSEAPSTTVVTRVVAPAPPPAGDEGQLSPEMQMQPMSEEDTKAMGAAVTGAIANRTEEEKAAARQRTLGNTFSAPK